MLAVLQLCGSILSDKVIEANMQVVMMSVVSLVLAVVVPTHAQLALPPPSPHCPRLAVVVSEKAPLLSSARDSKRLSLCPKGCYLTVVGQKGTAFAVLCPNHRTNYIAKKSVKLLPYTLSVSRQRRSQH